jgi:hypothetical protein
MQCPGCSSEIPRARLLTAISGRTACSHCRVRVRPRLKHKGVWILAVVLAQAMSLSALWVGSPVMAEAMLTLGAVTTVLIGLMALYSFEPALVD